MATPPKPVTDNVISSAWGGAVHDKLFTATPIKLSKTSDATGWLTVTAADVGLTTITSLTCSVGGVSGDDVNIRYIYVVNVWVNTTGANALIRIAQGTNPPTPLAGLAVIAHVVASGT